MVITLPKSDLAKEIAARAKGKTGGIKAIAEGRSDVFQINPYLIEVEEGFNARSFDNPEVMDHVNSLALSISKMGVQKPLTIRNKKNKFYLTDGECRLRATFLAIEKYGAEIRAIPCRVQDRSMSEADAVLSLVVDNNGMSLQPLEQGAVFKRLMSFGWTFADIADKAGITSTRVMQLVDLQGLPDKVKEMIRTGKVAATLAATIAREHDFDEDKTVACLEDAACRATAGGKQRVTARHISGTPRLNLRKTLCGLFSSAMIENDDEEGEVVVAMSAADWAEVEKLLHLATK